MKLHLPLFLRAAVLACVAAYSSSATAAQGGTMHLYILTGQSNSLGAMKGDPASSETLAFYSTDKDGAEAVKMWDGNMSGSLSSSTSDSLAWSDDGKTWMTVQPQQAPSGNGSHGTANTPYETMTGLHDLRSTWEANQGHGVMGPEYGFAYMMQRKGWGVSKDNDDIAVIKVSRDGGDNTNWDKPAKGTENCYTLLLDSVMEALKKLDKSSYTTIQLDGLMYLQGESNGTASNADTKFTTFVNNLKADIQERVNADDTLKNIVKIGENGESANFYMTVGEPATWGNRSNSVQNDTAANMKSLADSNDKASFVYTRDLDKIKSGDNMGVHYDGNSEITIGARYAYAMAAEQGMDVTEGGTVRVRSQEYGDNFSAADRTATDITARTPLSLNEAAAWWRGANEAAWTTADFADKVVVWDVSSANMLNTTQGSETLSADLTVGGIRIEDPYAEDDTTGTHNATIAIKNAESADATLTVGDKGIELQRGNLNLQTKVTTNADQTWKVAGGKTLTVANSLGGNHTVTLGKHDDAALSSGVAQFNFSAVTDAGTRTWDLGDGVQVALSDNGFANSSLAVGASATATLTGGAVTLNSLILGNGAALDLADGLTLSAGSVDIGNAAALTFNYSNGNFSALNAGAITAVENSAVTINLGQASNLSRAEFTLGTGWSGWTVASEAGSGKVLTLGSSAPDGYHLSVDSRGNLILCNAQTYPDVQKTWVTIPSGATVTASAKLVAANSARLVEGSSTAQAVLVSGSGAGNMLLFGAYDKSMGEGNSLYTEMRVSNANFISNVGTFTSSTYPGTTVTGDYNMKIADGSGIAAVFGASNIKVVGDVYTELSANSATYTSITYGFVGVFGADVTGDVSLVVNSGTFNNDVNVRGILANGTNTGSIGGTLTIEVNGGTLQNIYVSDDNAHTINAAQVILNGGTVNGSIYGGNTGVTITNGTAVYIGGEAIVKGDVYGGTANAKTGKVTLHDMAEDANFLTNFVSGKSIYADNIVLDKTTIGSGFNGTLHATTVTINEGSSLAAGKLAEGATLTGKGDYKLAARTQTMTSGVTLADDWAGTVVVSGNINGLNLNKTNTAAQGLYKSGSTIRLDGWTGYFANASQQIDANIEIGAGGANITNGWGADVQTFAGKLSGKGNITRTNASNVTPQLKFTGDVSEYTGTFVNNCCNASYGMTLTFSDSATTLNANFKNDELASGTLALHFAAADTTLNGSIIRDSNYSQNKISLTLDATATSLTINNAANITSLTAADKTITLGTNGEGDTATHGALTVNGTASMKNLTLGAGSTATFNGNTTIANLTLGAGTTATFNGTATIANLTADADSTARITAAAGNLGTLTGSGLVEMTGSGGNGTTTFTMAEGTWTGTVKFNAARTNMADIDLSHYGVEGSTIAFQGAGTSASGYSYLKPGQTVKANLLLEKGANDIGLKLTAGASDENGTDPGSHLIFEGAWKGDGSFQFITDSNHPVAQQFIFVNDMTGYKGAIVSNSQATFRFGNGNYVGSAVGSATGLGTIKGSDTTDADNREMHVIINYLGDTNSDNSFTGHLNLTKDGNATHTLKAENSYSGTTTVKGGALVLRDSGSLGTGTVTLEQAATGLKIGDFATLSAKGDGNGTISGHKKVSASGIEGTVAQLANLANISIEALFTQEVTTQDAAFIRYARFENVSMLFGLQTGMTLSHVTFDAHSSACLAEGDGARSGAVTAADTTIELGAADVAASPALLAAADGGSSSLTSTQVINLSRFNALTFTDTLTLNDQAGHIKGIFDANPEVDKVVMNLDGADLTGVTHVTYNGELPTGIQTGIVNGAVVFSAEENLPEPSTATLSLLALAAMAARRRRKAQ